MAYTADYKVPYIDKLVAKMEADDKTTAFQLPGGSQGMNILNDPAFSLYDFDKLRTFEDDPYLKAATKLRDTRELRAINNLHYNLGYTYMPSDTHTADPEKVYVDELRQFADASKVPIVEQEDQTNINKELATITSHEFRHNLLNKPKYKGIVENAYETFGGKIPIYDLKTGGGLEEYINTSADLQLNPDSPGDVEYLDRFQSKFNKYKDNPEFEGYEFVPTTSIFNNAATAFFDRVRKNKIKQKEAQIQSGILQSRIAKDRAMIPGDGRVFQPPSGGGGGWSPSGADLSPGGGYGQSPTGRDIAGTPFSKGGRIGLEEGDAVGGSLSELAGAGFHAGVSRDFSGTTGEDAPGGGDYVSPGYKSPRIPETKSKGNIFSNFFNKLNKPNPYNINKRNKHISDFIFADPRNKQKLMDLGYITEEQGDDMVLGHELPAWRWQGDIGSAKSLHQLQDVTGYTGGAFRGGGGGGSGGAGTPSYYTSGVGAGTGTTAAATGDDYYKFAEWDKWLMPGETATQPLMPGGYKPQILANRGGIMGAF